MLSAKFRQKLAKSDDAVDPFSTRHHHSHADSSAAAQQQQTFPENDGQWASVLAFNAP
jgi:hypothetical protein